MGVDGQGECRDTSCLMYIRKLGHRICVYDLRIGFIWGSYAFFLTLMIIVQLGPSFSLKSKVWTKAEP